MGGAGPLDRFLDQLQRVQPRAVLIGSVSAVTDPAGAPTGTATLTLTMQVYLAPSMAGQPGTRLEAGSVDDAVASLKAAAASAWP